MYSRILFLLSALAAMSSSAQDVKPCEPTQSPLQCFFMQTSILRMKCDSAYFVAVTRGHVTNDYLKADECVRTAKQGSKVFFTAARDAATTAEVKNLLLDYYVEWQGLMESLAPLAGERADPRDRRVEAAKVKLGVLEKKITILSE
jgi:hypothetical protein